MSKQTDKPLFDDTDNPPLNPNSNPKPILADENISNKQFNDSSAYVDKVSYNLDGTTPTQRKELKKRLTSELEKVKSLQQRIESVGDKKPKMNNPFAANEEGLKNPVENAVVRMKKTCGEILKKLMEHKWSRGIFGSPVDAVALKISDYHTIVSSPMDLGTVKSNLENGSYTLPIDFANDVRLTFTNAMTYNPKGHEVYRLAEKLLGQFDGLFKQFFGSSESNQSVWNQNQLTKPIPTDSVKPLPTQPRLVVKLPRVPSTPRTPVQPLQPPQPVSKVGAPLEGTKETTGRLRKPRAKDPNKREMKTREKETLSRKLKELPPDKHEKMIQILSNSSRHLPPEGDEIRIDMKALDTETLWELDRLVINYEHMVNKIKRREPVVTKMESAEKKGSKGGDAEEEEEDVDIGEEIAIDSHPSVDIEKDDPSGEANSSGSSSSNGSSSSSDSESES